MRHSNKNIIFAKLVLDALSGVSGKPTSQGGCEGNCKCNPESAKKGEGVSRNFEDLIASATRQARESSRSIKESDLLKNIVRSFEGFKTPVDLGESHSRSSSVDEDFPFAITMADTEKEQIIKVIIPGIARHQICVSAEQVVDEVSLSVIVTLDGDEGRVFRSPTIPLASNANLDELTVKLELGILTVVVPYKAVNKRSFNVE